MVDNISKPFTFVANTYAKASEVNADFDALYTGTNACINQVNNNITSINNLDSNKANKNGSTQEIFKVKDPENNSDAVNKQSMIKAIGNSIDVVSGFIITKDQDSPDDTISVSSGSCYDSTKSVILSSNATITKQNESQASSTTYYVYVTSSNSSGSPVDIVISSSSVSPSPTPTRYRQIGKFTTDSSGNIELLYSYGSTINGLPDGFVVIVESYVNGSSGYNVYSNKYCEQWGHRSSSGSITFLKEFKDTNYTAIATFAITGTRGNEGLPMVDQKTKTGMNLNVYYSAWTGADWRVCGYIN